MSKNSRVTLSLLLIQAISVVVVWTGNSLGTVGQEVFTLFLAVDLVAFALMGEVYRSAIRHAPLSRGVLAAGSLFMFVLLAATLFIS